ncbi:MAG: Txe/YoeB family addiction module toxin [Paludibacteraceae bacterium]|nr:Txe/YoeB family addiction module toxin [Paludibacteraceae bacterium]
MDKTLRKWKKSNPVLFDKTRKVLVDIMQHPRSGIGHPEPMVGGGNITYSRRITANERIIYDVYDQIIAVLVVQVGNHYNDK